MTRSLDLFKEVPEGDTTFTAPVSGVTNPRETHLAGQFREKALGVKAREVLGRGATAVTDAVVSDSEERFANAVDRNECILEKPRSARAQAKIAKYLDETEDLRAGVFKKIGMTTAEQVQAIAMSPFVDPPPPEAPVVQRAVIASPPPKKTVVIVRRGGLFRPDQIEEVEV